MAIGFVLIQAAPTRENDIYKSLLDGKYTINEGSLEKEISLETNCLILEAHILLNPEYDLIAKIEAPDLNKIGSTVINYVRRIPGVIDTKTLTGLPRCRANCSIA